MSPKGTFSLLQGQSKKLNVQALPTDFFRENNRGSVSFEYQIRGVNTGITKDTLSMKIVPFGKVFEVGSENIDFGEDTARVYVKNLENLKLGEVIVSFDSVLFKGSERLDLEPLERKEISIELDKKAVSNLVAGSYIVNYEIEMDELRTEGDSIIRYLEKTGVTTDEQESGLVIKRQSVVKTNQGNVPTTVTVTLEKNSFSRLFTSFSENPIDLEREGQVVTYTWEKELEPGESFEVVSTTNYTFPVVLLILVVLAVLLVRMYLLTIVTLNKKVSYVRTRGGEFALKVTLRLKAKKHVNSVQLTDRLPNMTKLYEKFGKKPDRFDEKSKRLFWNIGAMNKGEERVVSYVIYSKIRVVGRFELSPAAVVYDSEGKVKETKSNRTFFVSETTNMASE
jgi:hypothetical protein